MSNFLLDTHAFIWWIEDNVQLTKTVIKTISDPSNTIYVSAASIWEISIKIKIGKLKIEGYSEKFLKNQLIDNSFTFLPISLTHSYKVHELPLHHKDPFDQMLISQAISEKCPIITRDSLFDKYEVKTIW
jgi:PIN domain nuclease of toxin-antitoxin system